MYVYIYTYVCYSYTYAMHIYGHTDIRMCQQFVYNIKVRSIKLMSINESVTLVAKAHDVWVTY